MSYACALCGALFDAYSPTCQACQAPNALRKTATVRAPPPPAVSRVADLRANTAPLVRTATGLGTLDLALGQEDDGSTRGFVHGAAYVLSGPEGAGKSTLALLIGDALAPMGVLLGATEETHDKLERRVTRTGLGSGLPALCTRSVEELLAELHARKPRFGIVDSLHGLSGKPDENARALLTWAHETQGSLLVVAHEVLDGTIRGSKEIAYWFDGTIRLLREEDLAKDETVRATSDRYLVMKKNRFGPDGCWKLRLGARGWEDPGGGDTSTSPGGAVIALDPRRRRARRRF